MFLFHGFKNNPTKILRLQMVKSASEKMNMAKWA